MIMNNKKVSAIGALSIKKFYICSRKISKPDSYAYYRRQKTD